ncbi:MAG: minor capsid protein [Oscillospiraceae bacterium]
MIKIQTPRGIITKNGKNKAELQWNKAFAKNRTKGFNSVQVFIDSEVLRKCDPYVPMDTGMLKKSGILGTVVGSGEVIYIAPYARKQYYNNSGNGNHNKSGLRGSFWFERMKADHKNEIFEGAKKIVKGSG